MGDNVIHDLEIEYCPPLDTALFYAIVSDYDLSETLSINDARLILDALKNSAAIEGDTFFDPSGSSRSNHLDEHSSPLTSSGRAQSWHGDAASESTDITNLSAGLDSLDLDGKAVAHERENTSHAEALEALSVDQKRDILCEMFPTIKLFDVGYVLNKTHQDFGKAVEELLNQSFLELESFSGKDVVLKKGIDGFMEPDSARGRRPKGRRRKQQLRRTSSTPAPSDGASPPSVRRLSRWDRAKNDVDFLAQRINLPPPTISSAYHASGASLPLTINSLCTSASTVLDPHIALLDADIIDTHATELALEFPSLPRTTAKALVQLTHPFTASAVELAGAALTPPSSTPDVLIPQYVPRPASPSSPSRQSKTRSTDKPFDTATRQLQASAAARSKAFTQASAAYRKSKSKPLMGGAASYYSSVGRDATASLRRYEAAAADALVTSQSRAGEIDLHGVNVKDAVRIAQDHVEDWWEADGQEWARAGKAMGGRGLRIVTGVGRHSEGGRGKLGPAVGAMLVREGWKVEIEQGVIKVVGKARR
ncbi:MAG: hypothetical protein LQ345_005136 [Seirophora villosa]|nr:MAG: hypothetical protein LQ345_005136 [Seirophora villosa]